MDPATGESSPSAISQRRFAQESSDPKTEPSNLFELCKGLAFFIGSFLALAEIGRIHRTGHTCRQHIHEEADDDHHLFEILKNAGIEINDELARTIEDEVARIKAPGAREVSTKRSGGIEKTWKKLIGEKADNVADLFGYVLLHSASTCIGGIALLGLLFAGKSK